MGRGHASELAQSSRTALASTPLGKALALAVGPAPDWAKAVEHALGWPGYYLTQDKTFEVDVPSADFPAGPVALHLSAIGGERQ